MHPGRSAQRLTLSILGKNSADNPLYFFSYFSRKQALTFHANCLHEMSEPIFCEKIRKNIINLSSAELAQRGVKVDNDACQSQIITMMFM